MAIQENILKVWANQGAMATSETTYTSIKNCLATGDWNGDMKFDRYLQGSYRNSTNIYGNSDVDVVVELTSTFYSNKANFTDEARREYDEYYESAKFGLDEFKDALIKRLKIYYGDDLIEVGEKAIRIIAANGRLDADIVCCSAYRKYKSFSRQNPNDYDPGITFLEKSSRRRVINFPKLHYNNGTSKNTGCNTNFKAATRILKNMKSKAIDKSILSKEVCPSYFLECLLYNVDNSRYRKSTWHEIVVGILNEIYELKENDQLDDLLCQNGITKIIGQSNTHWNKQDAKESINSIIKFWNEY